jgi:uncharacterized protein involved in exopolysaccharide biosynthesis
MSSDPASAPPRRAAPAASVPDDEISLWEVLAVLIRRRQVIVRAVVVCAALAVVYTFLQPRTWTTEASFRPQGASGGGELVALAAQFGVNVGGGEDTESPAFYQELLASREILSRVAAGRYPVEGGELPLVDVLEIEASEDAPDPEALRLVRAVEWLREQAVSVSTGRETGVLTLSVQTEWPEVSRGIADRLLAEVSRFNLETRQSQAGAERAFVEERVEAALADLEAVEAELQAFLESNRQFEGSPQLVNQFEGLQREVALRQQVYSTLVQSYEQARISEVRDTPVLTVLQRPFVPVEPDGRGLVLRFALGVVLGGMLGVVLAFLVEVFRRPSAGGDPARDDFQEAWNGFLRSLPLRRSS